MVFDSAMYRKTTKKEERLQKHDAIMFGEAGICFEFYKLWYLFDISIYRWMFVKKIKNFSLQAFSEM